MRSASVIVRADVRNASPTGISCQVRPVASSGSSVVSGMKLPPSQSSRRPQAGVIYIAILLNLDSFLKRYAGEVGRLGAARPYADQPMAFCDRSISILAAENP